MPVIKVKNAVSYATQDPETGLISEAALLDGGTQLTALDNGIDVILSASDDAGATLMLTRLERSTGNLIGGRMYTSSYNTLISVYQEVIANA